MSINEIWSHYIRVTYCVTQQHPVKKTEWIPKLLQQLLAYCYSNSVHFYTFRWSDINATTELDKWSLHVPSNHGGKYNRMNIMRIHIIIIVSKFFNCRSSTGYRCQDSLHYKRDPSLNWMRSCQKKLRSNPIQMTFTSMYKKEYNLYTVI